MCVCAVSVVLCITPMGGREPSSSHAWIVIECLTKHVVEKYGWVSRG